MTQSTQVLEHFKKARILTPREARSNYRIESLSSVVSSINKAMGIPTITKAWKTDVTGAKYAEYYMI